MTSRTEDLSKIWAEAVTLRHAWWDFSTSEEREAYQKENNDHQRAFFRSTQNMKLFDKLYDGEIEAIGTMIFPSQGEKLEKIPRFMFSNREHVIWQRDEISGLGRKYGAVKLVSTAEPTAEPVPFSIGGRTGRPSVEEELADVVQELKAKGELGGISRKEQETRVRTLARARYPDRFPTPTRPSRTSVLNALKQEGFGLASRDPKNP